MNDEQKFVNEIANLAGSSVMMLFLIMVENVVGIARGFIKIDNYAFSVDCLACSHHV